MIVRPYRNELKYSIHYSARELLLQHWDRYIMKAAFTNQHAVSPVLSQYYDSPDLAFVYHKKEGLRFRNKVRLRVYAQNFEAGALAFLEIKSRRNDYVKKYRQKILCLDPETDIDPDRWRFDDPEARDTFCELRERFRLRASAQTYYQREAYEGIVENDVRITFDSHLIGLYPGERVTSKVLNDQSRSLMPDTNIILELKSTKNFPAWIYDGIKRAELRQQPVPKYTTAIKILKFQDHFVTGKYT
jgi:hypothetical protein